MLAPNSTLQNRYLIVRELGHGGMGTVYEAIDQRVSCVVALKQTLVGANTPAREAFQREAALLANLRHASLPKVMDYFSEGAGEFLVMEYIAGDDLAALLEQQQASFPLDQVLAWADELLKLLDYLHTRVPPIVHRDIKPANLKVTNEGEIFLLDFGLAKGAAGQMATVRTDGSVHGYTPLYAPLEQIHGQGTDPRTDIYSLGATLYDLLTGQPPVAAPVRYEAIENERADPLLPANRLNSRVPAVIAEVIQNAMALSRRNRFSSAAEMRKALQRSKQTVADVEAARKAAEKALDKNRPDSEIDPDKPLVTDSNVEFTVYSPRQIKPEKNYTMLAFAHLAKKRDDAPADEPDPIDEMKDQAARILGKQQADYDDVRESGSQPVPREGEITFVPIVPGITFSPASRTFTWRKTVHREEFDLWVAPDLDGKTLSGQMTVFLGSLVIAEVPLQISVNSRAESAAEKISLDGPQSSRRVRQIFASYSHQDEQVVTELAQLAPLFGSRFVLDRTHLEPGEDRREGLQRLIRGADVFQLFWSTNAMRSADIVDEVKYAVSLERPGFILPTYWEEPLPRSPSEQLPPPEIDRLQFHRIYPGAISHSVQTQSRSAETFATAPSQAFATTVDVTPTGELGPIDHAVADTAPLEMPQNNSPTRELPPLLETLPAPQSTFAAGVGGAPTFGIVICATCGISYPAGRKFCGGCGGTLMKAKVPDPIYHAPAAVLTSPTQSFQAHPAEPGSRIRAPQAPAKRRFPMMPIYAGAALVLFAVIVVPAWFMMSNRRNLTANSNKSSAPNLSPIGTGNTSANTNQTSTNGSPRTFRNSVGTEFVLIQPGSFMMGSTNEADEQPVHEVTINYSFYIGKYEVTQAQWQAVMGDNPSYFHDCSNCPVDQVSWDNTQKFIQRLNGMNDRYTYRLPSEAEWEYACRAGTTGDFAGNVVEMAWYEANSDHKTHAVGGKQPNAFGLYDMHGNVFEWCQDWYHERYLGAPTDGSAWLSRGESRDRVLRGGAWDWNTPFLRSANRNAYTPDSIYNIVGFRVVAVAR